MVVRNLNPYDPASDGPLRVSKSSWICYLLCPRMFWFDYIIFHDKKKIVSDAADRGKLIHKVAEDALKIGGDLGHQIEVASLKHGAELGDLGLSTLSQILTIMAEDMDPLVIESVEDKLEVYDEDNDAVLVGKMDAIFRHPDGGLIIVELKTGNVTSSKMTKFRKELTFYRRVLSLHPDWEHEEVTHYCVIAPDCTDTKFVNGLLKQKRQKRTIYLGDTQGLCIVEPVMSRTIRTVEESLTEVIRQINATEWPMKWNDYFCLEWCDYSNSCEEELVTGVSIFGD